MLLGMSSFWHALPQHRYQLRWRTGSAPRARMRFSSTCGIIGVVDVHDPRRFEQVAAVVDGHLETLERMGHRVPDLLVAGLVANHRGDVADLAGALVGPADLCQPFVDLVFELGFVGEHVVGLRQGGGAARAVGDDDRRRDLRRDRGCGPPPRATRACPWILK